MTFLGTGNGKLPGNMTCGIDDSNKSSCTAATQADDSHYESSGNSETGSRKEIVVDIKCGGG